MLAPMPYLPFGATIASNASGLLGARFGAIMGSTSMPVIEGPLERPRCRLSGAGDHNNTVERWLERLAAGACLETSSCPKRPQRSARPTWTRGAARAARGWALRSGRYIPREMRARHFRVLGPYPPRYLGHVVVHNVNCDRTRRAGSRHKRDPDIEGLLMCEPHGDGLYPGLWDIRPLDGLGPHDEGQQPQRCR